MIYKYNETDDPIQSKHTQKTINKLKIQEFCRDFYLIIPVLQKKTSENVSP